MNKRTYLSIFLAAALALPYSAAQAQDKKKTLNGRWTPHTGHRKR